MALQPPPGQSRLDRRFDQLRSKVEQEVGAANQQQQEALQRRGAALGQGSSGAFMKLNQKVAAEGEKQKQNALNEVDAAREGAQAQLDEQETQRAFAREERLGSQDFQKGMAGDQMRFAREERLGGQAFQSSEAAAQRGFSKELFDKEMDFKNRVQSAAESQFLQNLERVDRQFWEDNRINDFNQKMAEAMWNKKDLMELFGEKLGFNQRDGKFNPAGSGGLYNDMFQVGRREGGRYF